MVEAKGIKEKYKTKNLSNTYIVPLINTSIQINKNLLVGTYIHSFNYPNLIDTPGLFLVFEWSEVYENYLLKHEKDILLHEDLDDNLILVFIKLKEEYIPEYEKILEGKYSNLLSETKKIILNYHCVGANSKLYKVLNKSKDLKNQIESELNVKLSNSQELGEIINLKKEIFKKVKND